MPNNYTGCNKGQKLISQQMATSLMHLRCSIIFIDYIDACEILRLSKWNTEITEVKYRDFRSEIQRLPKWNKNWHIIGEKWNAKQVGIWSGWLVNVTGIFVLLM
jgi:hypothetical protein